MLQLSQLWRPNGNPALIRIYYHLSQQSQTYSKAASKLLSMDAATRKQYFADNPPPVVPLQIKPHFEALSEEQKLYAHYLSR